jgi:hypothetical protein
VGSAALFSTTGGGDTAVGLEAGEGVGSTPNVAGDDNTFIGAQAAPGTDTVINFATAIGAHATVSESDAVSLGDETANVGIGNDAPNSRLQIGNGATEIPGNYLQIPVLLSTAKTPPAGDCNNSTLVGRIVLLAGKKMSFFACSPAGVWVKV